MTNAYYHEFSVGFNLWYIMVPVMLIGMFFVGFLNVKRCKRSLEGKGRKWVIDRRFFKDYLYIFFGAISTVAFAAMFIDESMLGCIQVLDNIGISNEDGAWSPIFAFCLILPVLCFIHGLLTYAAASLGEHVCAAALASVIEEEVREDVYEAVYNSRKNEASAKRTAYKESKEARKTAHKYYFEAIEEQHKRREAFANKIEDKLGIVSDKLDAFFARFEKAIY